MHEHKHPRNQLLPAIGINLVIAGAEIVLGFLSGSMALIADALHNLTDISSMILSYAGEHIIRLPSDHRRTFGYRKAEMLIALVNGAVLLGVMGFVSLEGIKRFLHPVQVSGTEVMVVAGIALLGNGLASILLHRDATRNLNLRSAYLHTLQDALFSFGVIVAAFLMALTGWHWLDPLISIVIAILMIREVFRVMVRAVDGLLDAVPATLDFAVVKQSLLEVEGVRQVCDLHIWQTGTDQQMLTAHIRVQDTGASAGILQQIRDLLEQRYGIHHTTVQISVGDEVSCCDGEHCN